MLNSNRNCIVCGKYNFFHKNQEILLGQLMYQTWESGRALWTYDLTHDLAFYHLIAHQNISHIIILSLLGITPLFLASTRNSTFGDVISWSCILLVCFHASVYHLVPSSGQVMSNKWQEIKSGEFRNTNICK